MAATVELLHTASLIHDDINDHSDTRRGQASVNALLGNSLALLIGDFIFIKLLGLMAGFGPRAIHVLADACRDIIEGETLQMLSLGDTGMTEETYLKIVTQKTASLFSASTKLGALIGGGTEEQILALAEYGLNLGIAFQIRDDTLDLAGDPEKLGKPVGSDLEEGKFGLAVLYGLQALECMENALQQKDVRQIQCLLEEVHAVDYADQRAAEYVGLAGRALARLPASAAKSALYDLADSVVHRDK
ncbi:MAG: polyprenyl synthetase family protein [Chloroflexi bacterium]|nr:polyprenyl synthetase family protein [Chloroflexota bacterium]